MAARRQHVLLLGLLLVVATFFTFGAYAQSAPQRTHLGGLQVTAKTASTISLSWANWYAGVLMPEAFVVVRDGTPHVTLPSPQLTYTDNSVGWGRTYRYFVQMITTTGQRVDSDVVAVTTDAVPSRLNIVLVVTDDQRWDTVQYMPLVQQLLVQKGVTFSRAFASTPQCCPSRAGILTGLYSHTHGVVSNSVGARAFDDTSTVATWLAAAGYRTGLIGKYLNGYGGAGCLKLHGQCFTNPTGVHPWPYVPPGWNDWHAFARAAYYDYTLIENGSEVAYGSIEADYSTDVLAAKALNFIRTTPVGQPFFLYFAPFAPHGPAKPAKPDRGLYAEIALWRPPSWNEADVSDKPAWVQALPLLDDAAINEIDILRRRQLEALQAVDRAVKAIVDEVTAAGRLESTVFIFTSDNGQAWGEHRWDAKMCAYDECSRVPLVVRAPNATPRTDPHLVTLLDLVPSLAAWTGTTHPARINGLSLVRLITFADTTWTRNDLLIEMLGGEKGQEAMLFSAVRTATELYVEYLNGDRELYDLVADPYALVNLTGPASAARNAADWHARLESLRRP